MRKLVNARISVWLMAFACVMIAMAVHAGQTPAQAAGPGQIQLKAAELQI